MIYIQTHDGDLQNFLLFSVDRSIKMIEVEIDDVEFFKKFTDWKVYRSSSINLLEKLFVCLTYSVWHACNYHLNKISFREYFSVIEI